MPYANATNVENQIKDVLNAASAGWGTAIDNLKYSAAAITKARIDSGSEILRAIAANTENGFHGSLCALVTVTHNAFLPGHDGEPGIPLIVPFNGATAREGYPADPDEIESFRADTDTLALYSPGGLYVAHDAADENNQPSPNSCKYSIVNGRFKFTGYSAQIPLIQLTRTMADSGVPDSYEPSLVKLAIPKLVKEGDNLYMIAQMYGALGQQDLFEIRGGKMTVKPLPMPSVVMAQKRDI